MGSPHAGLTRSGRYGERDDWAPANGVSPGGFDRVPDLATCQSLSDVKAVIAQALPSESTNTIANFAAQLWALAGRMAVGDYVVLPLKTPSQVAIRRVASDYEYRSDQADPDERQVRSVNWIRTDIPRPAIKQDLPYSLGDFSGYSQVTRNEAAARIAALAETGTDPGSKISLQAPPGAAATQPSSPLEAEPDVIDADESATNLQEYAQDPIQALIHQESSGHRMALLMGAPLTAQGYTCWRSSEGADGGIDLLAGSGPLGLDPPQLVVQVKSEVSPIGDPVISQLLGTTTSMDRPPRACCSPGAGLLPPVNALRGTTTSACGCGRHPTSSPKSPASTRRCPRRSAPTSLLSRSGSPWRTRDSRDSPERSISAGNRGGGQMGDGALRPPLRRHLKRAVT